jgi:hypothetical protein
MGNGKVEIETFKDVGKDYAQGPDIPGMIEY